jgi:hypothetical protein
MSSIPARVTAADQKDLNPIIGRTWRLIARWSCSTTLLRYLLCRSSISVSCSKLQLSIAADLVPLLSMVIFAGTPCWPIALHLLELAVADRVRHIPPHAPEVDLLLKMTAFEIDHRGAPRDQTAQDHRCGTKERTAFAKEPDHLPRTQRKPSTPVNHFVGDFRAYPQTPIRSNADGIGLDVEPDMRRDAASLRSASSAFANELG